MSPSTPDKSGPKTGTVTRHQRVLKELREPTEGEPLPPPTLDWMNKSLQWGVRVKPGKKGLTMGLLNVGIYGEIPDFWEDRTRMLRGSYSTGTSPQLPIMLRYKHELWADNAADLYEEAIQRRWVPATDVPWATQEPLPEDVEIAMCQLATELCQQANVESEIVGTWLQHMSYGYHEVKIFLATEVLDAARHFDAFRKRALSNGGGLGLESRGELNRVILQSFGDWSECSLFLHVMRGSFALTLYRFGEAFAHNPAEKEMFSRCLQDKGRHMAYALAHLRYALSKKPDMNRVFNNILGIAESQMARDLEDPVLVETLAVIMGGGVEGVRTGMRKATHVLGDFVRQYLSNTKYIGVDRSQNLHSDLAAYLES